MTDRSYTVQGNVIYPGFECNRTWTRVTLTPGEDYPGDRVMPFPTTGNCIAVVDGEKIEIVEPPYDCA